MLVVKYIFSSHSQTLLSLLYHVHCQKCTNRCFDSRNIEKCFSVKFIRKEEDHFVKMVPYNEDLRFLHVLPLSRPFFSLFFFPWKFYFCFLIERIRRFYSEINTFYFVHHILYSETFGIQLLCQQQIRFLSFIYLPSYWVIYCNKENIELPDIFNQIDDRPGIP